jgi:hypothetical protein
MLGGHGGITQTKLSWNQTSLDTCFYALILTETLKAISSLTL